MRLQRPTLLIALGVSSSFGACKSAAEQRESADRAVYAILEQRRHELLGDGSEFAIEPPEGSLRQRLIAGAEVEPLSLVETLEIAAENSRDYQTRKESLYLTALDLTLARYAFEIQQTGLLSSLLSGDLEDGPSGASGNGNYTLTKLLGTGAQIVGNIGVSLARTLTTADDWDLTTTYGLAITQPLLRGAGERIVKEPLTQAERNVVYEVRTFERFRHTFAVDVASRYYRILQQYDQVANEERNFTNLQALRERNEELAEAGRLSDIQVDQARQDELRSKNNLITQRQRLEGTLDDFKLFLGLPIASEIALEANALDMLIREDAPLIGERDAINAALAQRYDYLTALDRADDSERQIEIAADALRASLDVELRVNGASNAGRPLDFDSEDGLWTAALGMDLPIDRLRERNAYREALIDRDQAVRDAEELADQIESDLRDSLRTAEATLQTLEIQRNAVRLAERRVESTRLNLEAGRADTRDILEAQDALLEAQNAVTAARIDHHLARLTLWRDVEALVIDEGGITLETEFASAQGTP